LLFWDFYTGFHGFRYFKSDFRDFKYSNGLRLDFKEFISDFRDFSD